MHIDKAVILYFPLQVESNKNSEKGPLAENTKGRESTLILFTGPSNCKIDQDEAKYDGQVVTVKDRGGISSPLHTADIS